LQRNIPPDGNPFNTDRIQASDVFRKTESDMERGMRARDNLFVAHTHTLNGKKIDPNTHLMCSRCHSWKPDKDFTRDKYRLIRRKRSYYCQNCLSHLNAGYREARRTG
jgi:predicted SprT family Zn-dependent metalloprotease